MTASETVVHDHFKRFPSCTINFIMHSAVNVSLGGALKEQ